VLVAVEAEPSSAAVCDFGVDDSAEELPSVSVGEVDDVGDVGELGDVDELGDVGDGGVFTSDEVVDAAGFSAVDDESDGLVEADDVALESVGSASATPGMVAAAQPTPSATASAPTRPTYLT
jgi:hypothetical protein